MNYRLSLATLILLTGLASFSALLYTPALPEMMRAFHISKNQAHMTLTVFLIGYMLGQFVYGPITNRFGRKSTIYFGICIGITGALICTASSFTLSYPMLLTGLFITALGTSVGLVISFAMINDVYAGVEAREIISYATLAFAALPGVAALIGGLLVKVFPWVSCFIFLIVYSLFIFYLATQLPETSRSRDPEALRIMSIIRRYKKLCRNKQLIAYALIWGLSSAIVYLFAALSPNIVINTLKASPAVFGLVNLTTTFGLVAGNLTSAKFASKVDARKTMLMGFILVFSGSIGLALVYHFKIMSLLTFYLPIGVIYYGLPLIFTNASALAAQDVDQDDKATASSMITLLNLSTAVFGLTISNSLVTDLDSVMPFLFIGIVVIMSVLYYTQRDKNDDDQEEVSADNGDDESGDSAESKD